MTLPTKKISELVEASALASDDLLVAVVAGTTRSIPASKVGPPPGSIIAFAGAAAPSGWLLCDGSAVSREDYSDLFDAIGTDYGPGDGSTTFNVPDLQGRTIFGAGDGLSQGDTGGAQTHTLTVDELPPHTHTITTAETTEAGSTISRDSHETNLHSNQETGSTGDGDAHNNMPPYGVARHFIIRH